MGLGTDDTPLFNGLYEYATLAAGATLAGAELLLAGEVDVAYVADGRFWPVEVKWSEQARPAELKQIRKYDNGRILTRSRHYGTVHGLPTTPLPLALLRWPDCRGNPE